MNRWKRTFYTIWIGQAFSILSSAVLQMALIWHLSATTRSAAILSLASVAGFLPMALLGTFAGAWVDRLNRKRVMIAADLFIAAVSLVLAIVAGRTALPVWLVLVVLLLRSVGAAFHSPAISAVTPLIVPQEALTKCAGMTQLLQNVGYIIGAAVASALYGVWSISGMVYLDVAGAILGCLAVAVVQIPEPQRAAAERTHILKEMRAGYQMLRRSRGLIALLWIGLAFTFLFGPINALFPLMIFGHFQGGTGAAAAAEIAFSAGMLLGGALMSTWGGFKNRAVSLIGALGLMGTALLLCGLLPGNAFPAFVVLCIAAGLSSPLYTVPQTALMQERIPPEFLGRAFGIYGGLMSLAMPLGLALSGAFADTVGIPLWFRLTGIGVLMLAALSFLLPSIRRIEGKGQDEA